MFFLMALSLIMLYPLLRKNESKNDNFERISICAVTNDDTEHDITTPSELPDDIDFFIITYTIGDYLYKMCRNSVTVPQHIKKYVHTNLQCAKAIAINELGNTRDVTDVLQVYSGPDGNFIGNEISVVEILKHHHINDITSVLTVVRDTSFLGLLRDPKIQLHTPITTTNVFGFQKF